MNLRRRLAIGALALLLLASCSTTRFAYNRADWLVAWEVGKYVDLEGPSKQLFDSGFASLWQWHRSTQLAAYARDLRELADAASGPVTEEQVRSYWQRGSGHGRHLFEEAIPLTARVLQALDDAQVKGLLEKMAEERRDEAEEESELTPEKARDKVYRERSRMLRKWLGGLSDPQKALVRDWAAARRVDPALWQRAGEQWGQAFEQLLAARTQPGFEERVFQLFWEPELPDTPALLEVSAHNRDVFIRFVVQLVPTLSDEQRRHLRSKLIDLAEDLEALAAQAKVAA